VPPIFRERAGLAPAIKKDGRVTVVPSTRSAATVGSSGTRGPVAHWPRSEWCAVLAGRPS